MIRSIFTRDGHAGTYDPVDIVVLEVRNSSPRLMGWPLASREQADDGSAPHHELGATIDGRLDRQEQW
jgi:hypothetical protein